eukprot:m.272904 g.272904  ORF g.272904 m.272904 type:complete len:82 (+) comp19335_c0_seq2:180-425(+)
MCCLVLLACCACLQSCCYDHSTLRFFLDNEELHDCCISSVRGTVFPVFYVDGGAIIDVNFTEFWHEPPPTYGEILFEQSLL